MHILLLIFKSLKAQLRAYSSVSWPGVVRWCGTARRCGGAGAGGGGACGGRSFLYFYSSV